VPGPRFFAYCYRLPNYQGAVASKYQRQQPQAQAPRAAQPAAPARTMSLAEWAGAHPHVMEAAYERAAEGR